MRCPFWLNGQSDRSPPFKKACNLLQKIRIRAMTIAVSRVRPGMRFERDAFGWNRYREQPQGAEDARLSTGMATPRSRGRMACRRLLDCIAAARPEGRRLRRPIARNDDLGFDPIQPALASEMEVVTTCGEGAGIFLFESLVTH
jgi:hypothetical protein